jgi:hypothetical protein
MLTSCFYALSILIKPPHQRKSTKNLPAGSSLLTLRNIFGPRTAAAARAPPSAFLENRWQQDSKGGFMFINEFYMKLISNQERSRLFDVLRRLRRLELRVFLSTDPEVGWPEWPPLPLENPGPEKT